MRPSDQVRELATSAPGASTDELLHKLLANLTAILGARRAYVTELLDLGKSRTIASWEDNERGPVREYELSGTPCAAVMRHGVQVVDCELGERFTLPESSLGYGCESFVGSPIVDHDGNRIGQLCVFGAKPLEDSEMASALVSLAAVRVSAELEHRQHEDLLRRQRVSLEVLLGNLPGMAYRRDTDESRSMHFVSEGCEALTGYNSKTLASENVHWGALIHAEDRDQVRSELCKALAENRSFELQYRINTRDGSQKWVWERGCGIEDDDGKVRFIEGFIADATALKESEAALARSEAFASAIVKTAAEGIITLNPRGRIESFNKAAEKMFGYAAEEVIGEDVHILMPEPSRSKHAGYVEQYVRTGKSSIIGNGREVQARRKDGSVFPIYLAASEIFIDGERCFTGMIRDISEQKRAEEEAKQHRERIAHVSRLSTLGEMAAGIAHEINQPLTAISLFAQAGRRLIDAGQVEKMDEVCHKLNEHALRASDVVERMQSMARQGESVKELANCNDLIESAVKLAESEARIHDIAIDFNKGDDLPDVSVDGVQIQQVALNLLRNGMEAMLADDGCRNKSMEIATRLENDGQVEVAVTDHGAGIPDNRIDKMFTPFATTKKSGMGMGLSISQAIVRAHGGRIDFRNNEAGGATFWFTLPAVRHEDHNG